MRHTVLLVDDDVRLLDGLRRSLRREPYEILVAESGDEALKLLISHDVSLVVSDEQMPGISGTELLARVRAHRPDTIRILLTGCQDMQVAMRAINQGEVYRFFAKPCETRELADTIRQALQQRALLVQSRRLLDAVKRQGRALDELEEATPGIATVRRDAAGYIVIDEGESRDLDHLLREMETEVDRAERRLHTKPG